MQDATTIPPETKKPERASKALRALGLLHRVVSDLNSVVTDEIRGSIRGLRDEIVETQDTCARIEKSIGDAVEPEPGTIFALLKKIDRGLAKALEAADDIPNINARLTELERASKPNGIGNGHA